MNSEIIVKTVLSFYPDVVAIYLFGSYLTPDQQQDSDADVALLFSPEKAKLLKNSDMSECRAALENVLKRTVDLINLGTVNTVFQNEVIQHGRIIYRRNEYSVERCVRQIRLYYAMPSELPFDSNMKTKYITGGSSPTRKKRASHPRVSFASAEGRKTA